MFTPGLAFTPLEYARPAAACSHAAARPCGRGDATGGACRYHLTLFYPREQLTLPLSVTKAAVMVAQMLSAPLAAALLALEGAGGMRGWQWLTLIEGAATVAAGLALLALLPASPGDVSGLTDKELAWIRSNVSKCAAATSARFTPPRRNSHALC